MSGLSSAGGASGTGRSRRPSQTHDAPTPAEHHLGDRLAALVDGELDHDARERVLAHLATCRSCKAEADAQRKLKNVFADAAPPPPSDGLLARLQGLPAGGPGLLGPEGPDDPDGPGSSGGATSGGRRGSATGRAANGLPPHGTSLSGIPAPASGWPAGQLPGGRGYSALSPARGFRIHEPERSASRGRRFAFAAAGAFSLAALALGGAVGSGVSGGSGTVASGDSGGASVGQARTASGGSAGDRDGRRRGAGGEDRDGRSGASDSGTEGAPGTEGTFVSSSSGVLLGADRDGQPGPTPPASSSSASAEYGPMASGGQQTGTFLPQASTLYPLLRHAMTAPPLIRSSLTSAVYAGSGFPGSAYGGGHGGAYGGGSGTNPAEQGRTPVTNALSPAPAPSRIPGSR